MPAPPPAGPEVSVVVASARDARRLVRCLRAVLDGAGTLAVELVVVLDAAEPALRAALDRDVPQAAIVASAVPLGFAGAVNLGARRARGRLLHVLHDDAEVQPGWLHALLAALDAEPRAGAVGSLLLGADGRVQTAGHVLWRDGRTQPPWLDAPPAPDELVAVRPVDYCSSASLLVRRAAWEAVGGMDEELHPAQYVDVDLALALRHAGWLVVCAPASRVRHLRGGSASARLRTFAARRNRARLTARWAAELARQEPWTAGPEGLARAAAATLRRAGELRALPAPAPSAQRPPADDGPDERAALLRDNAFKAAYVAELEAQLARADDDVEQLRDALAAVTERHDRLHAELTATHAAAAADAAARTRRIAQLERAAAERERRLAWLAERDRALAAVEAGGWWRLRGRLAPLLGVAARLRGRR